VAVTPDGARVYVTVPDAAGAGVVVIDTATRTIVDTVQVGRQPHGLAIMPFISDVGISQSATPDPVMSGANLTYTVTVISNGPDPALSITMTDKM
jgi:YVTN family beta-propeller protein